MFGERFSFAGNILRFYEQKQDHRLDLYVKMIFVKRKIKAWERTRMGLEEKGWLLVCRESDSGFIC